MILNDNEALELMGLLRRAAGSAGMDLADSVGCGWWADAIHDDMAERINAAPLDEPALACAVCGREATGYRQSITTMSGLWLAMSTYQHERGACSSSQLIGPSGRIVRVDDLMAAARVLLVSPDVASAERFMRRHDAAHTVVPGTCDRAADCHMRLRGCGCPPPDPVPAS